MAEVAQFYGPLFAQKNLVYQFLPKTQTGLHFGRCYKKSSGHPALEAQELAIVLMGVDFGVEEEEGERGGGVVPATHKAILCPLFVPVFPTHSAEEDSSSFYDLFFSSLLRFRKIFKMLPACRALDPTGLY
jgi:hypothetical protein